MIQSIKKIKRQSSTILILAIETSCDETAVSILQGDKKNQKIKLLSNVVSSQVKIHAKWGGVVPNLAAREHLKNIIPVLDEALKKADLTLREINFFAVTQGPGLIPALLVGVNFAKTLSYFWQKPLLGIHHIEGHIYANLLPTSKKIAPPMKFPWLSLVVSGGHTQLILIKNHFDYQILGETQDDAVGEAFDKVAKLLGLGYPGGPIVSHLAQQAEEKILAEDEKIMKIFANVKFPRPMLTNLSKNNYDFSFSGLKTAVLYFYQKIQAKITNEKILFNYQKAICKEFQDATTEVLVIKTIRAMKKFQPKSVILAGGVAANQKLRADLKATVTKTANEIDQPISFTVPAVEFCGDNAAMVGMAAFYRFLNLEKNNKLSSLTNNWKILEADANLKLDNLI